MLPAGAALLCAGGRGSYGHDDVVAFSCEGPGVRPSCGARMVKTAAWLCDAVIPEVRVRQWVLSLP